jgi:hypothetical protein
MGVLVQASAPKKFLATFTNPVTVSLTGVTAGSSILVCTGAVDFTSIAPTMTVNDGSAYTLGARNTFSAGSERWMAELQYLHNVGSGTHNISVTCADSTVGNFAGQIVALEISGLTNAGPDKTATGGANSNTPATGSTAALTQADEMVIALLAFGAGNNPAGLSTPSGYTNVTLDNTTSEMPFSLSYKNVAATTAVSASWGTATGSNNWSGMVWTFANTVAAPADLIYPRRRVLVVDTYYPRS